VGNSFKLFSVRGIDIRVHITFPLILIWAALQFGYLTRGGGSGAAFGVLATILLFAIVVLHELGHSLAAQYYGVTVKQIVLLPIGGVAQLERIPEKPIEEFVIAIAGPLVNFTLAILLAVLGLAFSVDLGLADLSLFSINLGSLNLTTLFRYVFTSNLFLAIFNLIPAFPMDGGRVLRAIFAARMPYTLATDRAVVIGQLLAWLLGLWGFLQGGLFLIIIAVFIYMGAGSEGQMVRVRNVLGGLTVDQAYSREPKPLDANGTLRDAVALTLKTFQSDFPICEGEQLIGILTHARLVQALDEFGPDVPLRRVMAPDIEPVHPEDGLDVVQKRLAESKLDALPVVEDGRFLGLITSRDVAEAYRLVSSRADIFRDPVANSDNGSRRSQVLPERKI
jgi:stage IV sporulation protein FB